MHPISRCSWQYSLFVSSFCVLAGGVLTNIVFGVPPRVITSDFLLPCTVISWYLINYSPDDVVFRLYHHVVPFRVVSESLHRVHQLRSVARGVALGRAYGTSYVGALVGGLVAASASSFVREYYTGGANALQKPGYTFTVLSWAAALLVSNIVGKYTHFTITTYLVLVEIYFGLIGSIMPEPFPLNYISHAITSTLKLRQPNSITRAKTV